MLYLYNISPGISTKLRRIGFETIYCTIIEVSKPEPELRILIILRILIGTRTLNIKKKTRKKTKGTKKKQFFAVFSLRKGCLTHHYFDK